METAEKTTAVEVQQPPTSRALEAYRKILVLTIKDQDTLGQMAELVKTMKDGIKLIEAWYEPMKTAAHKAHKAICDKEKETLATFRLAETDGQKAINVFLTAEKVKADALKLKQEQDAAAERLRQQTELNESAAALEEMGDTTTAAALREDAERVIAAPTFVQTVDKTVRVGGGSASGGVTLSSSTKKTAQVVDVKAFLKYLVEKGSEATFVEFPKAKLNAWVVANGIKAGEVPGLAIEEVVNSSIR
jgi:hypothetical protein